MANKKLSLALLALLGCHSKLADHGERLSMGVWTVTSVLDPVDRSARGSGSRMLRKKLSITPNRITLETDTQIVACSPASYRVVSRFVKHEGAFDPGQPGAFSPQAAGISGDLIFMSRLQCDFEIYCRVDNQRLYLPWNGQLLVLEASWNLNKAPAAEPVQDGPPAPKPKPTATPAYLPDPAHKEEPLD